MKIAILLGSSRTGRQSHKIAHYLEAQLALRNVHTDLIDLGRNATQTAGLTAADALPWEEAGAMSARIQAADALMLVTPEYHGSFSGVIKNALDNLGTELYRKPVGVVAVSSGKMGGLHAIAQLQHVVLHMGGFALPAKLLVPDVQTSFDEEGALVNERTVKSAGRFLDEYLWLSEAIADHKEKQKEKEKQKDKEGGRKLEQKMSEK